MLKKGIHSSQGPSKKLIKLKYYELLNKYNIWEIHIHIEDRKKYYATKVRIMISLLQRSSCGQCCDIKSMRDFFLLYSLGFKSSEKSSNSLCPKG